MCWKSELETGNPPLPKSGIIKRATAELPQLLIALIKSKEHAEFLLLTIQ